MSRVIVLKFGGSVLRGASDLRRAVHEVYRWRRSGWRVVAVPSALAGETEARLGRASAACGADGGDDGHALGAALATGELESAAWLGVELERAGVAARVLCPGACGLRAAGDPLDASPESVDAGLVRATLAETGVAVVPGFVACDASGAWVTLGRGGSDLSALVLAHELGAERCRLVKDVDGLYERDPKGPGAPARRYGRVSWDDALRLDGSIVQHKAVRYARDRSVVFELTDLNGRRPTLVGGSVSELAPGPGPAAPVRVAVLGGGTVGGGVVELLSRIPGVELIGVAVRDRSRARALAIDPGLIVTDPLGLAGRGGDIVVEAMGGIEAPRRSIERALRSGSDVVSANKAVLSAHGASLRRLAGSCGGALRVSGAVGGGAPVLERLASRTGEVPARVRGVLCGTANSVLESVRGGVALGEALERARRLGLAESDASRDLDGRDAADKLAVVAQSVGVFGVETADIEREPIDARALKRAVGVVRQVAQIEFGRGAPAARVGLERVGEADALRELPGAQNAVEIEWRSGEVEVVRGVGAGRWATSESVVGDVLELMRERREEGWRSAGVVRAAGEVSCAH